MPPPQCSQYPPELTLSMTPPGLMRTLRANVLMCNVKWKWGMRSWRRRTEILEMTKQNDNGWSGGGNWVILNWLVPNWVKLGPYLEDGVTGRQLA